MVDEDKYCKLRDVRISLERVAVEEGEENRGFSLSFWIYLLNSTRPSSVILHQKSPNVGGEIPFLSLSDENKLMLFPLLALHEEAPLPGSIFPLKGRTHLSPTSECPFERWVHIGCQVTPRYMCLHINGIMVAGTNLVPVSSDYNPKHSLKQMNIVGNSSKVEGYFYNSQILPSPASMKSQYTKDQPVRLSIENSSIPDGVDLASDGIWNIVGGKPSCRRNFSLEVCLLNACGQPVYKDLEIGATLLYADNNYRVERSIEDSEEPLLISCDGVEFPSTNRPLPLVRGHASFKLKMAKLSSKSDNRLFRVFFRPTCTKNRYPFLEAYSAPIRCISRSKVANKQPGTVTKPVPVPIPTPLSAQVNLHLSSLTNSHNGHYNNINNNNNNIINNNINNNNIVNNNNNNNNNNGVERASDLMKEDNKLANQNQNWNQNLNPSQNLNQNLTGLEYNSPPWKRLKTDHQNETNGSLIQVLTTSQEENQNDSEETATESNSYKSDSTDSDSNSNSNSNTDSSTDTGTVPGFPRTENLPDAMVFRYCLENSFERAAMLRHLAFNAPHDDVADFAKRVCLYSGCSHHRNQILATKQLIQDGEEIWATISRNNNRVLWTFAITEIVKKFMSIAKSCNRGLSGQDLEILRSISGCTTESMGKEEFDKLWYWIYPVALSLSKERVNKLWDSSVPRWIEGFITREDSENALRGPIRPGTFVLRFPTSRSWPHPDAGSIVISYLGTNFLIRHKLLALDYCDERERDLRSLLMEEPELTQLGRVNRQEMQYS